MTRSDKLGVAGFYTCITPPQRYLPSLTNPRPLPNRPQNAHLSTQHSHGFQTRITVRNFNLSLPPPFPLHVTQKIPFPTNYPSPRNKTLGSAPFIITPTQSICTSSQLRKYPRQAAQCTALRLCGRNRCLADKIWRNPQIPA